MKTIIEKRTIFLYIIFSIVMIVVIGLLFDQIARFYVNAAYEDQLINEGQYIAEQLEETSTDQIQSTIDDYSEQFNLDLFYNNQNEGRILHTFSNRDLSVLQTVRSNTGNKGEFVLIENRLLTNYSLGENESLSVMTESLPLSALTRTVWWTVFFVSLFTIILLWRFGARIHDSYVKPVIRATETSKELANGNYDARVEELPYGVASQLGQLVNRLGRHLQNITSKYENQNSRLKTVVNNMESGVLLINEKGMTRLVNEAFLSQFTTHDIPVIGEVYYDVINQEEINQLIQRAIFMESRWQETIELADGRFFEIYIAPIKSQEDEWRGVVIVTHEITELKRLERVRKDFVANVSHELKTPVTSIQGFAETLLEDSQMDRAKQEQFLTIIKKESNRLNILVQDLLDLSVLEKESYTLTISQFPAHDIVDDVHAVVNESIQSNELKFNSHYDHQLMVQADYYRLYQLLLNLIHNSIQYTSEGGSIDVRLFQEEEQVVIEVEDTGIGIPESAHDRIFERFYRVDKARSRHSGGTGLGLSIVKHIVEVHEGSIEIDSEEDEGTTIRIKIPQ
ncbi:two-component system histidine kinase PnpS [Alkalibacillus sp. S2W]|uniref:two-component system histidine kinase PnpS n=1 Tax=Alkalibacillus sp. S2W TaxID=3386553 RepID=UPI00398CAF0F